jgi:hypothetical protein
VKDRERERERERPYTNDETKWSKSVRVIVVVFNISRGGRRRGLMMMMTILMAIFII